MVAPGARELWSRTGWAACGAGEQPRGPVSPGEEVGAESRGKCNTLESHDLNRQSKLT